MGTVLPDTIDGVLGRLNGLLDDSIRHGRRIGYFVGLYERVTANVRHALIAGNVFDDGPRMERLDVVFANRFLEAWDRHAAGLKPTDSWAVAFERLDDPGPLVVQHLMLGMNAHINLDLGIAAATVAPTRPQLEALHADFNRINDVLSRLVKMVEVQLTTICPPLSRLADLVTVEERIFDFGMTASRDVAWKLAQDLVAAPRDAWPGIIARRDALSAMAARALYPLDGVARVTALAVHAHECRDIRLNIQIVGS
jgi:hypothetical protein